MICQEVYDVFFSYARKDNKSAQRIVNALEGAGLKVWIDVNGIPDFKSIVNSIKNGLACSKIMVAYYSTTYPNRQYCQWEFTSAFLAGQREGDPLCRIVVLNPEPDFVHIMPSEIKGALCKSVPNDIVDESLKKIAENIADYVSKTPNVIGQICTFDSPPWYGRNGIFYQRFVGRLKEMWDIHSKLNSYQHTLETGGTVQISGMGGIGKSLLVEEYAMRFGSAYPGGIFWLSASQVNNKNSDSELLTQLSTLASEIGINIVDLKVQMSTDILPRIIGEIKQFMQSLNLPCLWIVDDVPQGINSEALRKWFAPCQNTKTLMTTRSTEYAVAVSIELDVLAPEDAYTLLTSKRNPKNSSEETIAQQIVKMLGFHALAVDVASSALTYLSYSELLSILVKPDKDGLEFASSLSEQLPNGHEASIAITLMKSIDNLSEEAKKLLIICSCLSQAPITKNLIYEIYKLKYKMEDEEARTETIKNLHELHLHSLITLDIDAETFEIHELITRAVKFHLLKPDETVDIHEEELIIIALSSILKKNVEDIASHDRIRSDVRHAEIFISEINLPLKADLADYIAEYHHVESNYITAINLYNEIIPYIERELSEKEFPDKKEIIIKLKHDLASSLNAKGEYEQVLALQKENLQAIIDIYGEEDARIIPYLNSLARSYKRLYQFDEATELYDKAITISIAEKGHEDFETVTVKNNLVSALRESAYKDGDQDKLTRAKDIAFNILEIINNNPEMQNQVTLKCAVHNNIALIFGAEGGYQKSIEHLNIALKIYFELAGLKHTYTTEIAYNLYKVLNEMGEGQSAIKIRDEYLIWLLDSGPDELSGQQLSIKEEIEHKQSN